VPKRNLVVVVQVPVQTERLNFSATLPEAQVLVGRAQAGARVAAVHGGARR
jgi:hypothetical protein